MHSWKSGWVLLCRSVMSQAEAGNAFCALVDVTGGYSRPLITTQRSQEPRRGSQRQHGYKGWSPAYRRGLAPSQLTGSVGATGLRRAPSALRPGLQVQEKSFLRSTNLSQWRAGVGVQEAGIFRTCNSILTAIPLFSMVEEGGDAVNPAEGQKHSMPAEEGGDEQGGGRVKCIPQGRGGGCRGAVSQVVQDKRAGIRVQ
ncbi:hypothetical protein B0H14DRAFT_3136951 [Mycena olivaceomarginata]|nr:hypothetical protein B0H14DRAFT_3136951 [Mycena olivaceomarginata]